MTHAEQFLLAGVMGCPVMHSRSPKLHNYWLARHGLAGAYLPLAIPPEKLNVALRALPALGFAGCNLTIPHKQTALDFVDTVDPLAQSIGAVNCVVVRPDGSLAGFNHDAFGYIESVREAQPNWRADTGPIAVIGAGGAARAVIIAFVEQGAREIRLVNRTPARAKKLEQNLGGPITTIAWEHRERALDGAAMLVNTTNQGMIGESPLDLCPRSAAGERAGFRYRLHPARDAVAGRGPQPRQCDGQWTWHVAASGAPRLPCVVRDHARCHQRIAGHDGGHDMTVALC